MLNRVTQGRCEEVMKALPAGSVDFILTDPPYLVRYRDRTGRTVLNDDNTAWLEPSFHEMFRVLKPNSFAVSFYAYDKIDHFVAAWTKAGFHIRGHFAFPKRYASGTRFTERKHEQAYLLCKGHPAPPANPPPDVIPWSYTGNRLHPTQKPVNTLKPMIEAYTRPGDVVLDPFSGSGSTLVAARELGRRFIGIELDQVHQQTASSRLESRFIGSAFARPRAAPPAPASRYHPPSMCRTPAVPTPG